MNCPFNVRYNYLPMYPTNATPASVEMQQLIDVPR